MDTSIIDEDLATRLHKTFALPKEIDVERARYAHVHQSSSKPLQMIIATPDTLIIHVETDVHARVHINLSADNITQHQCLAIVEDGASLDVLLMQDVPDSARIAIKQRSVLGKHSNIQWHNITLGGKEVQHDLISHVYGGQSNSTVNWIFYAKGTEKQQISARNVFHARDGGGEITLNGVAEDTAHVQCEGMIEIGLEGGGTNTYLTEDVLMLDSSAKVDAIPGLEIKTNDVKASHSATVTRVSPEDLFYFGARGIATAEARRMFIEGFLGELTEKIEHEETRQSIREMIDTKYQAT